MKRERFNEETPTYIQITDAKILHPAETGVFHLRNYFLPSTNLSYNPRNVTIPKSIKKKIKLNYSD